MRVLAFASLLLLALPAQANSTRVLDGFEATDGWNVVASDQVTGTLRIVKGADGKALCLDYDFHGVSGYVGIRKAIPMSYPDNYTFGVTLRGNGPRNDFQFKLVDASGDNVWWATRPMFALPGEWTPMQFRKRHIGKAWGPSTDTTLVRSATLEFTLASGEGGKGSACFDALTFAALPSVDDSPLAGQLQHGKAGDVFDLGKPREFGGAILHWSNGARAGDYNVALSNDGKAWRTVRDVHASNGGDDFIALPEAEARYLRVAPAHPGGPALVAVEMQPLAFTDTPNDFIKAVASRAPRGNYPRGFSGEQSYWTIVGIDGGFVPGLVGEDGAVELHRGGISVMPFVQVDGTLVTWADVELSQSLQDGYLPIPSVEWTHPDFGLHVTAFARGDHNQAQMFVRYALTNTGTTVHDYVLALAAQPWQVNPPSQFLNTAGGYSPIRFLAMNGDVSVDKVGLVDGSITNLAQVLVNLQRPDATIASTFDAGMIAVQLRSGDVFSNAGPVYPVAVADDTGLASGAMLYRMRLQPGERKEVAFYARLAQLESGHHGVPDPRETPFNRLPDTSFDVAAAQEEVAALWRAKLGRVQIKVPVQGQHVVDTLRTALAYMLISRSGPRLQPGTRSYARAWIRDGAMIAEGLLRMGREDVAEDFLRWYAPYQFDNGKVPCCVDDRGSDPVPENDSQGELIYATAELYRYTRDRALLEAMWPHVEAALKYMDVLRLSERTDANRAKDPAFYGMMPASISHEGYSAKPMHSYWDDFWALRGYKDAVEIATWLGRADDAKRFAASRDEFRADLYASIAIATKQHGIDFIPGAVELGDFDATSTTIALAPGGEQSALPQALLHNTFERYWREFVARRDGTREWKDYTPYELRTIGSFVRLGWRERANEALAFFFMDQQPAGWNQWAEVVSRTPRTPFFLGDLPHAWVASDYVRSVLDMFAYSREADDALVIAAGIPADWLQGEGVEVKGLRTPQGALAYSLRARLGQLQLALPDGLSMPAGGVVLALPKPWQDGMARINGRPAAVVDGEVRIHHVPATVEVTPPAAARKLQ